MHEEAARTAADTPSAGGGSRSSLDPVTRWLVTASGIAVVAAIALTGVIIYAARAGESVPRTAVERDILVARQRAQLKPKDKDAWAELISADIRGERYDEAEAGLKVLETLTSQSTVQLLRGDLAYAKGDVSGARGAYEKAVAQAKKDYEGQLLDAQKKGLSTGMVRKSEQEMLAHLKLARLDGESKDYAGAEKQLRAALEIDPNAADALTALGDIQRKMGKSKDAEASYHKALTFVPDYRPALEGLDSLTGGQR